MKFDTAFFKAVGVDVGQVVGNDTHHQEEQAELAKSTERCVDSSEKSTKLAMMESCDPSRLVGTCCCGSDDGTKTLNEKVGQENTEVGPNEDDLSRGVGWHNESEDDGSKGQHGSGLKWTSSHWGVVQTLLDTSSEEGDKGDKGGDPRVSIVVVQPLVSSEGDSESNGSDDNNSDDVGDLVVCENAKSLTSGLSGGEIQGQTGVDF